MLQQPVEIDRVAGAPRREGTLGKIRLGSIGEALRAEVRAEAGRSRNRDVRRRGSSPSPPGATMDGPQEHSDIANASVGRRATPDEAPTLDMIHTRIRWGKLWSVDARDENGDPMARPRDMKTPMTGCFLAESRAGTLSSLDGSGFRRSVPGLEPIANRQPGRFLRVHLHLQ
jgi:hypothetical protein